MSRGAARVAGVPNPANRELAPSELVFFNFVDKFFSRLDRFQ